MEIVGTLVIAADTVVLPVTELSAEVRRRFQANEGDFAVMRRNSRGITRIVDSDAARLFQQFREPATVIQAILRYCKENSVDPQTTLEASFPLLELMVDARLLVAVDAPETKVIEPTLDIGSFFGGYEVLECLQTIEDTDVYKVRMANGQLAALKLMRSAKDFSRGRQFDREQMVLNHLGGAVAPALLRAATAEELRFLLLSWVEGRDCSSFARALRDAGDRNGLLELGIAILKTYTQLHAQNVLHADIHPGNILVDESCAVRLVDFGLARIATVEERSRDLLRGGVGYFLDAEYAAAMRQGGRPPQASFAGEQYSLGALLYLLLSGKHYLDFSLDRPEMERQIVEEAPLAFRSQSIEPWPAVETILSRALSKDAAARFASVEDFAAALSAASGEHNPASATTQEKPTCSAASDTLQRFLKRLDHREALFQSGVKRAPRASITYGSGGIAYALHRIACARQDAKILSLADLWCELAARDARRGDAWYSAEVEITADSVGNVSPYHTEAGIHFTSALIANAMCDPRNQQKGADRFIAASSKPCDNLDVTLGRSGTLLAASHLVAALRGNDFVTVEGLSHLGNDALAAIWQQLDAYPPIRECLEIPYTGIAHGWSGILYATLCWSRASSNPFPAGLAERLDQLAGLAIHSGDQTWWGPEVSRPCNSVAPLAASWCNGTAGHVVLWLAAFAAFGEERYLSLAVQAGNHVAETQTGTGMLCCGLSGHAYALLALYRQSGEAMWLHRARTTAERAALSFRSLPPAGSDGLAEFPDSLFKGELGVAVLAADLENPAASAFPAFEPIQF